MRPTIICLTPVFNEEWVIEKFLTCASLWADIIILSDQGSTDKTIEIARRFSKVRLIDNSKLKDFNEQEMRAPLFEAARKIPGKRLLVSLDADELFTPDFNSPEWETMVNAPEGARFTFNLFNILPGFNSAFTTIELSCAFMDDGSPYNVGLVHVPRQPLSACSPSIKFNQLGILHLQFTNWERMERKQMWYQLFEHIHNPKKSAVTLYRAYHYTNPPLEINGFHLLDFNKSWIEGYKNRGIDITSVTFPATYTWDEKIISYINTYGMNFFSKLDLGNINWLEKATNIEGINTLQFNQHINFMHSLLLNYLKRTHLKRKNIFIRIIDRILKFIF